MDGENDKKTDKGSFLEEKLEMEEWPVERKDGLMKITAEYIESAGAICFFLSSR